MATFKVPYALNETHTLVTPETATQEDRYVCPACQSSLILRQGQKIAAHFAHQSSDLCTQAAIIRQVANTCPYCHAIQGDFFLHGEIWGPFCGVNCEEDTPQAFKTDLLKIAFYA